MSRKGWRKYYWYCNVCWAQNSIEDGECQFCECQGAFCKRDNCSDPRHFDGENSDQGEVQNDHDFDKIAS